MLLRKWARKFNVHKDEHSECNRRFGNKNVTVFNGSITDAHPYSADMFVAGIDVAPVLRKYPRVVILKDLISYEEAERKIEQGL